MERMVLRSARIGDRLVDIAVRGGTITAIGRALPADGAEPVELDGRVVLPGLWDHHTHFDQWALRRQRLDLSTADSAAAVAALVRERLRTDPPTGGMALIGFGYRDGLWPDRAHRAVLDTVSDSVRLVMVAGDLHACWLNSAAARHYGFAAHPTGVLTEDEWHPVMTDVRTIPRHQLDTWVADAARAAAARGVVGIVDFEAPWQLDTWAERIAAGTDALRVVASVWPERLDDAVARGVRTGEVVVGTGGLLTAGPLKVITDGSLNTRTAYCHDPYPGLADDPHPHGRLLYGPDVLVPLMRTATANGIRSAIHAIGDAANTLALDAFAATGARGSVEHAQLLVPDDLARFAELGVHASIQPAHTLDDRDVCDRYWAGRTGRAFAYRALLDAGTRLTLGSDAPVAPLDPWLAIAAAVHRSADDREPWHAEQHIPLDVALAGSTGTGRTTPAVGDPADLVVLDADPGTTTAAQLGDMPVSGTLLAGRWTHRDGI